MTDLPEVKLKALVNFPANTVGRTGIDVTKENGSYYLDLDYAQFQITPTVPVGDMPNSYNLIWNEATHTFAKVPFALQATSGVSSLGGQTGAITLNSGLSMVGSTLTVTYPSNVSSLGGVIGALTLADGLSMVGSVLTPTGRIPVYDTATALAASASVDSTQTFLRTRGKLTAGDGGHATYLQVASDPGEPGSFALANGRYAKINEPVVTPEMFLLSTDAGDDALMFTRWASYVNTVGAIGVVAKKKTYSFATTCSITVPPTWRSKLYGYGAKITTSGAIWAFTVTGGAYSGGADFEGFTVSQQGNASALGAWKLIQAGSCRLISPVIVGGQTTNTNYVGIFVGQSVLSDSATGSFWNTIQDAQIFSTTTDPVPFGVQLEGAANATRVIGGAISTFTRGVALYEEPTASNYTPNGVVVDGVSFEVGTYGVYFHGVLGDVSTRPLGLRVINNRFESVTHAIEFVNVNQSSEAPPEIHHNMLLSTVGLANPNNIRVNYTDNPQTLAGTVTFSASTTAAVSFSIAQTSSNYIVTLEASDNKTYWVTSKATSGFTINASSATSATIGWRVTRL
jgi:hypothetical protein